jgi:hypothetical protein
MALRQAARYVVPLGVAAGAAYFAAANQQQLVRARMPTRTPRCRSDRQSTPVTACIAKCPALARLSRAAPRCQAPFCAAADSQGPALDPSEWRPLKLVSKQKLTHNSFQLK